MLSGVFFLIFLGGVILIVAWSAKMDRLPPGAPTSGLLAMRDPNRPEDEKSSKTPGRKGIKRRDL